MVAQAKSHGHMGGEMLANRICWTGATLGWEGAWVTQKPSITEYCVFGSSANAVGFKGVM